MNIKRVLKQKIGFYDKHAYSNIFFKLLFDLAEDKFQEEKKLFNLGEKITLSVMWSRVSEAVEENDEDYEIPKIVYRYLLLKAKVIYQQIVKFCMKEKFNIKDIVKIVRNTYIIFKYIDNSSKLLSNKWEKKLVNEGIPILKSRSSNKSILNSNSPKRKITTPLDKNKELEGDEDDDEVKKRNAMRKFTNIFIGNADIHTMNRKNQQIKIFEGQYCKTFMIVDKETKSKKMEVKNFSPSKVRRDKMDKRHHTSKVPKLSINIPPTPTEFSKSNRKMHSAQISPLRLPLLTRKSTINTVDSYRFTSNDSSRMGNTQFKSILNQKFDSAVKTKYAQESTVKIDVSITDFENKYGLNLKSVRALK